MLALVMQLNESFWSAARGSTLLSLRGASEALQQVLSPKTVVKDPYALTCALAFELKFGRASLPHTCVVARLLWSCVQSCHDRHSPCVSAECLEGACAGGLLQQWTDVYT